MKEFTIHQQVENIRDIKFQVWECFYPSLSIFQKVKDICIKIYVMKYIYVK